MGRYDMERASARERLCYAAGDGGAVLLLEMCGLYQVYFCTDVLGLGAAAAGVVVAASRIAGALADVPAGLLIDRTQTAWGRYRPWVAVLALPLVVTTALSFFVPSVSMSWKFLYAVVVFSLFQVLYSFQNSAYGALMGVLTTDDAERTRLSSLRIGFVMAALLVVQSFVPSMVGRIGWSLTACAVAAASLPLLVLSGAGVRERASAPTTVARPLLALRQTVAASPVRGLLLAGFAMSAAASLTGGSLTYYFPYVAAQQKVTFGLYNAVGIVFGSLSLVVLPTRLVRRFRLVRALVIVCLAAGAVSGLVRCLPTDAAWSLVTLKAVLSVATASSSALFWSVAVKVADEGGAGGLALVVALSCFSQKVGGSLGASGLAFALSGAGFVPHAALPPAAHELIRLAMSVFPALLYVVAALGVSRVTACRKEM